VWLGDEPHDSPTGIDARELPHDNYRDTLPRVTHPHELLPAYGWRAQIGFLQPGGANPHHPHEFYMMVPDGVSINLISLHSVDDPPTEFLSQASLDLVMRRLPLGARELAARSVDVIVQAGVPFTVAYGRGIEDRLRHHIAKFTDIPLVLDVRACIEAMHCLDMARVLMVAPFTDQSNQQVADYVSPDGIEVAAIHRVDPAEHGSLHRLPLGTVYQIVKTAHSHAGNVDGIWLPGAALPTVAVVDALERELRVPVVSSKQAMVWAALRQANIGDRIEGYGRLFDMSVESDAGTDAIVR
jgi:maleate isomerase